jgi:DNA invertase Pin-like site-specific DNA recombinase
MAAAPRERVLEHELACPYSAIGWRLTALSPGGGQLGVFLEMVTDGRIPKGPVLIVENIDRLSRLPPHEADEIIVAIVKAGVDIATTSPEQVYTARNINQVGTWVPLQVAQCLAAEESRKKGDRLADAWAAKLATAGQKKLSKKGPAWLKVTADRTGWGVIEKKAALVRKAFTLAAEGVGVNRIAGVLHKECPEGLVGRGWQPGPIVPSLAPATVLMGTPLCVAARRASRRPARRARRCSREAGRAAAHVASVPVRGASGPPQSPPQRPATTPSSRRAAAAHTPGLPCR